MSQYDKSLASATEGKKTYLDFAEKDYADILICYNAGAKGNMTCVMSQKTCERYLKHVIEMSTDEPPIHVMRSKDLCILRKFIEQNDLGLEADWGRVLKANGYYFTTAYPGDDSFMATEKDADDCVDALKYTREVVLKFVEQYAGISEDITESDDVAKALADLADNI